MAATVVIVLWLIPVLLSGSILSLTDLFMDLNNDLATLYGYYNYVMNSCLLYTSSGNAERTGSFWDFTEYLSEFDGK